MSDDTPQTPDASPPPEHPHGVVETIREEIHEVVEHVPKPVRWTVGKLVRVALLSLAALVVIVIVSTILYLTNRTELVAHELTLVLNQALARRSDVVLDIPDLKGNPLSGFRALRPRVRFRDGGTLLQADELRVSYSALGLLRGGTKPVDLTLVRPIVRLDQGKNGALRLPKWEGGGGKSGGSRETLFGLHVRDATVFGPDPIRQIQGLQMDVSGDLGNTTLVRLERMQWASGPWHSRLERLSADYQSDGDSVRVRVRELRSPDLALTARGGWRSDGATRTLHVDVSRVRWGWLAEVFDNDDFQVPGSGRLAVDATGGPRWTGRFDSDLDWDALKIAGRGRFAWDGRLLALDSLAGHSAAGDLLGHVRWSNQGWEIGGDARNADPSHWHAIHLDGWPAGRLNGAFRYVVDTRGKNVAWLGARLGDSEWAGWRVDSALVRVDFPAVARDSFSVLGWRRGGRFTLRAVTNASGWAGPYTIAQFPLDEWPDGRASGLKGTLVAGSGSVAERSGTLAVTGDLEGATTDWSAAHFARWRMKDVQGRLLPTPDLTATVRAADGFFVGIHLDSASAPIHLGDQVVTFASLHANAGDTLFSLSGNVAWDHQTWHSTMTYASATSAQFSWIAEPPLQVSGDAAGTVFDRVIADDQVSHLEVRGRWASQGGWYDATIQGRNLDLARLGFPPDWGLSGSGDATLAVRGRSGDPAWTFEGRAARPGFEGHRCDSLSLSLEGAQHRLHVTDLLLRLNGGEARAAGQVTRTARAWPDSLSATALVRWLQDAGEWDGALTARDLPIDRLAAFVPRADGWGGRVSGSLAFAGSPQRPEVKLDASATEIGWRDYRAQRVEAHASYRDGQLLVPDAKVTMQDVASTLSGSMPVVLALGRTPEVPDAPVSARAQVPRGDLKLLPALVPLIQSARGRFDLDATLAGTTRHPRLSGVGHIREGIVRPAGRDEVLEAVTANLHFDETRITLDSLTARQGRTGHVSARGGATLNGFTVRDYAFDLSMRDFASSQAGLYALLFDGDFKVVDGPRVQGTRVPQVSGYVNAKRGVIEFDFANQSEVQKRSAVTEPLYWTYHIHLDAASNLHWRPPDGDIEFDADLDLEQTPDSLLIYGEMHAVKGHYFFLSNRFTINTVDLTFDNQKGVDPVMDIVAQTRLRPALGGLASAGSQATREQPEETIEAHISGRSSQPVIELTSSSNWDQREILGELTYGRFTNAPGQSPTDPVQNYLTRQLNNQLSRDLATFFNDRIDQWEIQREQGELLNGVGGVYVSVGGAISPQVSWTVSQHVPGLDRPTSAAATAVSNPFERDVEVEYRISRFIYVTTELSQRRVTTSTPGNTPGAADFNVNLKARWEY